MDKRTFFAWALALAAVATPVAAQTAATKYFVVVGAYQGLGNNPRDSHTFAVFAQVSGAQPHGPGSRIETRTISWLPAGTTGGDTLCIIGHCRPVPGANHSLYETMINGTSSGRQTIWRGPYEVTEAFFRRAEEQVKRLESGSVRYKAIPNGRNQTNCHDAVADVTGSNLAQGLSWGHSTIPRIIHHFGSHVLRDASGDTQWLIDALGMRGF